MNDSLLPTARCPPLRQVRGTVLNTIIEDTRESQYAEKTGDTKDVKSPTTPRLKLQTACLPTPPARPDRVPTPVSTDSSSCSDTEWQRQMDGFDDMYDATDEESETSDDCTLSTSTRPTSMTTPTTRNSTNSTSRAQLPSLTIPPSSIWPSITGAHKSSPIPPTPPPKISVSSAALSMLSRNVPASHAPPSLDGSVSSEQASNISAPTTPDLQSLSGNDWGGQDVQVQLDSDGDQDADMSDAEANIDQNIEIAIENTSEDWSRVLSNFPSIPVSRDDNSDAGPSREQTPSDRGVALPEDAMDMLDHIRLNGTPDPWSETSENNDEMWQLDAPNIKRPRSAGDATPASDISGYSFSRLSIPSPGGFFASLGSRARHTWSIPNGHKVPSSATAQNFYDLPWRGDGDVVEQVVECPEREADEELTARYGDDGPQTAIRIPDEAEDAAPDGQCPPSPTDGNVSEIPKPAVSHDYDEGYIDDLLKRGDETRDRTSIWLAAQASFMSPLANDRRQDTEHESRRESSESDRKKCVRFSDVVSERPSSSPPAFASKDSIYWRGFQSVRQRSGQRDCFLHRHARFDAIQSVRLGLPDVHISRLMGQFELVPRERPASTGPFSLAPRNSVLASAQAEKVQFAKIEKEQLVLAQLQHPVWVVDALKYLNGGHLISSPALRRLRSAAVQPKDRRKPKKRRVRVLDLGGHASCEWAWYLAHDYPNIKVYTAVTKDQVANPGIKGPSNHHHATVSQLWRLPFPDNRFDVISARSLHALLKTDQPTGESQDEYDLCLRECYRCLKPGGYLQFSVMDAEISHAGPYAAAMSVEFAFNLRNRGYDAAPTKNFMTRLQKRNFVDVNRAWTFLPMGTEPVKSELPRETPDPRVKSQIDGYEPVQGPLGATTDIAPVTGLLGGWVWEQWLLKLRMEMGRERGKLLEGVGSVFGEGQRNGAGWTCLSGWARKPKLKKR